jgi:hypothetical protein
MKQVFFYGIAVLCMYFIGTPITSAYVTTGQQAFTVDGKIGVYAIQYTFGHQNHDIYIPINATRGLSTSNNSLSYEITHTDTTTGQGKSVAIVLSTAPIENHMYHIKKGHVESFTLLVLYTHDQNESSQEFMMHVTNLPFNFDGTYQLHLNPSELQYYVTKPLYLHT